MINVVIAGTIADITGGELSIFVVYVHPIDFPTKIVVREFVITRDGDRSVDPPFAIVDTIDLARAKLIAIGLTKIDRDPEDDPKIVECWL